MPTLEAGVRNEHQIVFYYFVPLDHVVYLWIDANVSATWLREKNQFVSKSNYSDMPGLLFAWTSVILTTEIFFKHRMVCSCVEKKQFQTWPTDATFPPVSSHAPRLKGQA